MLDTSQAHGSVKGRHGGRGNPSLQATELAPSSLYTLFLAAKSSTLNPYLKRKWEGEERGSPGKGSKWILREQRETYQIHPLRAWSLTPWPLGPLE